MGSSQGKTRGFDLNAVRKKTFRDSKGHGNGIGRAENFSRPVGSRAANNPGLWKRYRENGKLYDAGNYVDGKRAGIRKEYDSRGKLSQTKRL